MFLALVDTGSSCNLFPKKLLQGKASLAPTAVRLAAADGKPLNVYGELNIEFTLGNYKKSLRKVFNENFIISEVDNIILGVNYLTKNKIIVDAEQRLLCDKETGRVQHLVTRSDNIIINKINHRMLPEETPQQVKTLLTNYKLLMSERPKKFQLKTAHHIDTGNALPVFSKNRPLSPEKAKFVKDELERLLNEGVIRRSNSPWASAIHLVPKKENQSFRLCVDYRRLNAISNTDKYPIPFIASFTNQLIGCKQFSKIDLTQAYHFIPVRTSDIPKTAMITPFGLYEYLYMPFGLKNAASTFQRFMDNILIGMKGVFVYLDDILIYSKTEEEHMKILEEVFKRLVENGLRINVEKCAFLKTALDFLGYEISSAGIRITEKKSAEVKEFPEPRNVKALQRFLGMSNYYRKLIPRFAEIAFPLSEKLKNLPPRKKEINLVGDEKISFNTLKDALINCEALPHPSEDADYLHLVTDASKYCMAGALHEIKDGEVRPIGFFSKKFSGSQKKYSTFDRELTAAYNAVLHFKHRLLGSVNYLFVDHKPIVAAFKKQGDLKSDRQSRHMSVISEYVADVIYIPGKENVVADYLSRMNECDENDLLEGDESKRTQNQQRENLSEKIDTQNSKREATITPNFTENTNAIKLQEVDLTAIAALQEKDEHFEMLKEKLTLKTANGVNVYCNMDTGLARPFVPNEFKMKIMKQFHDKGHMSGKATLSLIKKRFYWHNMDKEIKEYCSTCIICQSCKVTKQIRAPAQNFITEARDRFDFVHIDIVGPLEPSSTTLNGLPYRYLLTILDRTTCWPEVIPLTHISAKNVAEHFYSNWITRYGVPLYVLSDRGAQFESELMSEICNILGITKLRTCSYRPQTNGKLERFHRNLKDRLKCLKNKLSDWLKALPVALWAIRSTPRDNGLTPFYCLSGKSLCYPQSIFAETTGEVDFHRLDEEIRGALENAPRRKPRKTFEKTPLLKIGDFVFVRRNQIEKRKLEPPYTGPVEVLQVNGNVVTIKHNSGKTDTVNINRLKIAKFPKTPVPRQQVIIGKELISEETSGEVPQTVTRSGRIVKFKKQNDYFYY